MLVDFFLPARHPNTGWDSIHASPLKAKLGVYVSGAYLCNHPALVSALARALASRRKPPKPPAAAAARVPKTSLESEGEAEGGGTNRGRSPGADADWLWDAKLECTDGIRLAVHDDQRMLCELAATVGGEAVISFHFLSFLVTCFQSRQAFKH